MAGIRKVMWTNCEGGVHDSPYQCDHECLTESKVMATYALDNFIKGFNPAEFISLLASMCTYVVMENKEFVRILRIRKKTARVLHTLESPLGGDSEAHSLLRHYNLYEYDLRKLDCRYIDEVYVGEPVIEETPNQDYSVTFGDGWMCKVSRATILYKLGFVQNFMVSREIWCHDK